MENTTAYEALLWEACVTFGFCGCIKRGRPLHVDRFVPSRGPINADQFVDWLFLADDMNPNSDQKRWSGLRDKLKAAFVRHMGAETVDAKHFRFADAAEPNALQSTGPLYRTIDVFERDSDERILKYIVVEYVFTAEFTVCAVETVDAGQSLGETESSRVSNDFLQLIADGRDTYAWSGTIKEAITEFKAKAN